MVILAISELECSCWRASSICMNRSSTRMSHGPRIGRIYVTQNDNRTISKKNTAIIPKTSFKHHRPLITPPFTFPPKRETISAPCAWRSSGLLDYDGMPKACKTIRKNKSDKVNKLIRGYFITSKWLQYPMYSFGEIWGVQYLLPPIFLHGLYNWCSTLQRCEAYEEVYQAGPEDIVIIPWILSCFWYLISDGSRQGQLYKSDGCYLPPTCRMVFKAAHTASCPIGGPAGVAG